MAVLIQAREAAGLKQREVSKLMKRSAMFCHRIEIEERQLAAWELPGYAAVLGVDVLDLVKRWAELDASTEPIPKRQDARRNNRVSRKSST